MDGETEGRKGADSLQLDWLPFLSTSGNQKQKGGAQEAAIAPQPPGQAPTLGAGSSPQPPGLQRCTAPGPPPALPSPPYSTPVKPQAA